MAHDSRTARPPGSKSANYAALVLFALLALYPIVQLTRFAASGSFAAAFGDPEFTKWLLNSALTAIGIALANVAFAWVAAKALARLDRCDRTHTASALIPRMFAAPLLLLPLYGAAITLGLTSSLVSVIIIFAALTLPFCVWQLKTAYDNIPAAIEEAALIDGCSRWDVSRFILLPLLWPAVAASALFSFMSAWTLCVFLPLLVLETAFRGTPAPNVAAMLLLLLPLLICLALFVRYVGASAQTGKGADGCAA